MTPLEAAYQAVLSEPSDIVDHLPKLREMASQCDHVTEFGMRSGRSTLAILAAQPRRFITYDVNGDDNLAHLMALRGRTDFEFRQEDTREASIEETDFLFIDTHHVAEQLRLELRQAPKVRRWIAMHDTSYSGLSAPEGSQGLIVALKEFLAANPRWKIVYQVEHCFGLTIIERVSA